MAARLNTAQVSFNDRPTIGKRKILAQTCTSCCKFLEGSRFTIRREYTDSRCNRCRNTCNPRTTVTKNGKPIGRPKVGRRGIVNALLTFEMTPDEIAENFNVGRRLVYYIAKEEGLDMLLRSKIVHRVKERSRLQNEIDILAPMFMGDRIRGEDNDRT